MSWIDCLSIFLAVFAVFPTENHSPLGNMTQFSSREIASIKTISYSLLYSALLCCSSVLLYSTLVSYFTIYYYSRNYNSHYSTYPNLLHALLFMLYATPASLLQFTCLLLVPLYFHLINPTLLYSTLLSPGILWYILIYFGYAMTM